MQGSGAWAGAECFNMWGRINASSICDCAMHVNGVSPDDAASSQQAHPHAIAERQLCGADAGAGVSLADAARLDLQALGNDGQLGIKASPGFDCALGPPAQQRARQPLARLPCWAVLQHAHAGLVDGVNLAFLALHIGSTAWGDIAGKFLGVQLHQEDLSLGTHVDEPQSPSTAREYNQHRQPSTDPPHRSRQQRCRQLARPGRTWHCCWPARCRSSAAPAAEPLAAHPPAG